MIQSSIQTYAKLAEFIARLKQNHDGFRRGRSVWTRKNGDKNYANYVGFQCFSSDEPTHRINDTNWHLKFENNKPGFFIQADNCFKQMPDQTFKCTAEFKSKQNRDGWLRTASEGLFQSNYGGDL